MEYGLIGGRLGHSYSKPIHEALAGYDYRLCPLPTPEEAHAFMRARDFKAINVTIPYKELVMPYCDVIDDAARAIGSSSTKTDGWRATIPILRALPVCCGGTAFHCGEKP